MRVGIFYSSITNPTKFPNKVQLMNNFGQGVRAHGDDVIEYHNKTPLSDQLDVGFVLGFTLEKNHRRSIIDSLVSQGARPVFVDSNVLHYARPEHEWHRYSLDTVYPDTGTYFFSDQLYSKWATYSAWHGIEARPWRTEGNHILILCQRPHGWNMFGNDQQAWLDSVVARIRKHSQRPIRIRMHPGDGTRMNQIQKIQHRHGNTVEISWAANIRDDLKNCWAAVGYNSTPNVVAAIEGVPVYLEDPQHSWAQDIAFEKLEDIENPAMLDRTQWLEKIANIHWSNQEVVQGKLWAEIKQYIVSVQK